MKNLYLYATFRNIGGGIYDGPARLPPSYTFALQQFPSLFCLKDHSAEHCSKQR